MKLRHLSADVPTKPSTKTEEVLDRWLAGKVREGEAYAPPKSLEKLAIKHGKDLGMKVTFIFTSEWQVHMDTKRGKVIAAPMIAEQTCSRCQGTGTIPHILDGGGEQCSACKGESVTVEQAWRNALAELGLLS